MGVKITAEDIYQAIDEYAIDTLRYKGEAALIFKGAEWHAELIQVNEPPGEWGGRIEVVFRVHGRYFMAVGKNVSHCGENWDYIPVEEVIPRSELRQVWTPVSEI